MTEGRGQARRREELPPLSRGARWIIGLGVVLAAGWFIWSLLPATGFSTDLQRIGAGQPVAVLVHETANPTSVGVMEQLEAMRDNPPAGVEFLVAALGEPEGRQFAEHFQAERPGTMLFFDAEGQPRERLSGPVSATEIEEAAAAAAGRY